MKTINIELTTEQITTENSTPVEYQLGSYEINENISLKLVFPEILFETIQERTFMLEEVKSENNEETHYKFLSDNKLFKSDANEVEIKFVPLKIGKDQSLTLKIQTKKFSKVTDTNVSIKLTYSVCSDGLFIDENDPDLVFNIDKAKQIGADGFYTIYEGKFRNKDVMIKKESDYSNQRTITIMKQLRHPNVNELLGYFISKKGEYCLIMNKGTESLETYYKKSSDEVKRKLLIDVAKGIKYLHNQNIVHLDIKPHNILIFDSEEGPVAKLNDFEVAEQVHFNEPKYMQPVGTMFFMSPEMRLGLCSKKADIYSFGKLVFYLSCDLKAKDLMIFTEIPNEEQLEYVDEYNINEVMKDLIIRCCAEKPEERTITLDMIIELLQFI